MTDDDFAADLSRLPLPRPSADRLHYAIGFAAGRRRTRVWQWTTAAAAAVAIAVVAHRPPTTRPMFVDRVVYVHAPAPTVAPLAEPDPNSLLRLRQAMLSDAAPPPSASVGEVDRHRPVIGAWMTEPPATTD
jgi:hypothetical protein